MTAAAPDDHQGADAGPGPEPSVAHDGAVDRDGAAAREFVLPMVVRIERAEPPTRTDALEAAAQAVLLMLTADRPEWADVLATWNQGRIRKVVRRARGAQWRRALTIDGLDVRRGTAEVRVYPPIPISAGPPANAGADRGGGWPPELSRLQVGGTELADPQPPPAPPVDGPLILLSPHLTMTAGKAMAQAAHAAQLGWLTLSTVDRIAWQHGGFELAVRVATPWQWTDAVAAGAEVVHDAGFTEVEPGSATALFTPGFAPLRGVNRPE